jgi:hypothetical protein
MSSSFTTNKSEPSRFFVFFYALVFCGFGLLLGVAYMMSFPLKVYSNLEERAAALEGRKSLDSVPGDAFYIEGPTLRNRAWERKREQFLNGGATSLRVTPGEVNAWFAAKFRSANTETGEEESGLTLIPSLPSIGVSEEGTLYLNLPAKIKGYGMDGDHVLSARARYASGAPAKLLVEHLQIGGAAVPLPGVLGSRIVSKIIRGFSTAEEYALIREAWKRVESVEIGENALVFSLRP